MDAANSPPPAGPDLGGDRDIENAWVAAKLARRPGRVLDFGCGASNLSLIAAMMGHQLTGLDLGDPVVPYEFPQRRLIRGDILTVDLGESGFDIIINCSSIEHVGLPGRYGSTDNPEGDTQAMARMLRLLAPAGVMILTLPVGRDGVYAPKHRVYGCQRLPRLLAGYRAVEKDFWIKNASNRWHVVSKDQALSVQGSERYYGLGLYVLRAAEG